MFPLCPWTHFAGQSVTALQGNLKICAGQIEKIDKNDGVKTGGLQDFSFSHNSESEQ
jgi:hypothetical protein